MLVQGDTDTRARRVGERDRREGISTGMEKRTKHGKIKKNADLSKRELWRLQQRKAVPNSTDLFIMSEEPGIKLVSK